MERKIHKIDATGQSLGRLATRTAVLLRGKQKSNFLRHIDLGDDVVIFNIEKLSFSGKKILQKIYWRHTGYLGGLKGERLDDRFKKDPVAVLRAATMGMLPKNRTRAKIIKRLKIYKGEITV